MSFVLCFVSVLSYPCTTAPNDDCCSPPPGVGTVGAVAVDAAGHVALALSTGGTCGKLPGRVGDTPLLGCGGYCDDAVGAAASTGHGESIMKACLASAVTNLMEQGQCLYPDGGLTL